MKKERLDRLISRLGYVARSAVASVIANGSVSSLTGMSLTPNSKVTHDDILWEGQALEFPNGLVFMLHKPIGYVCSHAESEGPSIYDLLPARWSRRNPKVVSVGRLDKDTSGLLLITDQGDLVHKLTSPKKHVWKTYEVSFLGTFRAEWPALFESGKWILSPGEEPLLPAKILALPGRGDGLGRAQVDIREGRYHQVRRMFNALGSEVVTLHRSSFGTLQLGSLGLGQIRQLSVEEIHAMNS